MDSIRVKFSSDSGKEVCEIYAEITCEDKDPFSVDFLLLDALYTAFRTYRSDPEHTFNLTEAWLSESSIEGKVISLLRQISTSPLMKADKDLIINLNLYKYDAGIARVNSVCKKLYTGEFVVDEVYYGDVDMPLLSRLNISYIDPVEKTFTFNYDFINYPEIATLTFTNAKNIIIYQDCNLKSINFVNTVGSLYTDAVMLSKDEWYKESPFFWRFLISEYSIVEAARLQVNNGKEYCAAVKSLNLLMRNIKSSLREIISENSFLSSAMIKNRIKSPSSSLQLLQEISTAISVDSNSVVMHIYADFGMCRFLYEDYYQEMGPSTIIALEPSKEVYAYQVPLAYYTYTHDQDFPSTSLKDLIDKLQSISAFTDS